MLSRVSWRVMLGFLILITVTLWSAVFLSDDDRLHLYFFDVGQGDSILVKQGNFELLVDGGPDSAVLSHLGRALPPWDRKIEVVVLTHPHADHLAGLVQVLQRYEVGEVWGTGVVHTTQGYLTFLAAIQERQVPFRAVQSGYEQQVGDLTIRVLYPLRILSGQRLENANDSSVVLKVARGRFRALLTGDLEERGQKELLEAGSDVSAEVIKVPHQGSRDADLPEFLAMVQPFLAVLSVGEKNRYGHPNQEVLHHYDRLGAQLVRTDRDGTIHLTYDGNTLWITTAKEGTMAEVSLGKFQLQSSNAE